MKVTIWCKRKDPGHLGYELGTFELPACPRVGEYLTPREGWCSEQIVGVYHEVDVDHVYVEVEWIDPEEWNSGE